MTSRNERELKEGTMSDNTPRWAGQWPAPDANHRWSNDAQPAQDNEDMSRHNVDPAASATAPQATAAYSPSTTEPSNHDTSTQAAPEQVEASPQGPSHATPPPVATEGAPSPISPLPGAAPTGAVATDAASAVADSAGAAAPRAAFPSGASTGAASPYMAPRTIGTDAASTAPTGTQRTSAAQSAQLPLTPGSAFLGPGVASGNGAAPAAPTKTKRKGGPGWGSLVAAMAVTAGLSVSGTVLAVNNGFGPATSDQNTTNTVAATQMAASLDTSGVSANWQAVASAVSPAVVTINASGTSSSMGSGVIYDARGTIVTNYHVISTALEANGQITVTLSDGRIFDATVVGYDQSTDLAVVRLVNAPNDLTVATFGSSSSLSVGQEVMAIGSPLGLSNTVTTGIISALDRPVEVSTTDQSQSDPLDPFGQLPEGNTQQVTTADTVITNAIQVDASINPGNSGGPLFDAAGAVIGINSSIASMAGTTSSTAGSIGLGFAIPSDLVVSVVEQLVATGSVDHAVLGVTIKTAAVNVGSETKAGAQIETLTPGGAADRAGLQVGDTIIAVDGKAVSSGKALSGYVRRYTGGSEVTLTVVRNGQVSEVKATLQSK
ncbi:S1C family serine protease [Schaalia suimastitidis]|uniref:S1C family serine protease n=1 Tax=Schaalia suimastitidis TaxID=121163 RepID=UPI000402F596|nr:trypsin-like peptidase domain-containing protein [Schaalia suimastitidis]